MNETLRVAPPATGETAEVKLSIMKDLRGTPDLLLSFVYCGDGWLFVNSVEFKVGTNVITLGCEKPRRDVFHTGHVFETKSWTADPRLPEEAAKVQAIIRAVAAGRCTLCALRGSEGDARAVIDRDSIGRVITAYFALGGQPLTMKEP